jgi:hypothetical protein
MMGGMFAAMRGRLRPFEAISTAVETTRLFPVREFPTSTNSRARACGGPAIPYNSRTPFVLAQPSTKLR